MEMWSILLVCCLVAWCQLQQHAESRSVFRRDQPGWLTGRLPPIVDTKPRKNKNGGGERRSALDDDFIDIIRRVPPLNFVSPFANSKQKLCFDCDAECQAAISGSVNFYFYLVTEKLTRRFEDVGFIFDYEVFLTPDVEMLDPDVVVDRTEAFPRFVELLESYWLASGRAAQYRQTSGCDINILVGKDAFFNAYNSIAGVTYFMSLCTTESVIVEKLMPNAELMASGLAHEIGHMTGLVHTGENIGPYYVGNSDVEAQCPDVFRPTCGTEQNMRELCIMVTALPSNTVPDEFSHCSKSQLMAFYEMRLGIDTDVYPYYRKLDECLPKTPTGEGEGEGSG